MVLEVVFMQCGKIPCLGCDRDTVSVFNIDSGIVLLIQRFWFINAVCAGCLFRYSEQVPAGLTIKFSKFDCTAVILFRSYKHPLTFFAVFTFFPEFMYFETEYL